MASSKYIYIVNETGIWIWHPPHCQLQLLSAFSIVVINECDLITKKNSVLAPLIVHPSPPSASQKCSVSPNVVQNVVSWLPCLNMQFSRFIQSFSYIKWCIFVPLHILLSKCLAFYLFFHCLLLNYPRWWLKCTVCTRSFWCLSVVKQYYFHFLFYSKCFTCSPHFPSKLSQTFKDNLWYEAKIRPKYKETLFKKVQDVCAGRENSNIK